MSTALPPAPDSNPSVTELVSGIVGDVQDLGMQHLTLFRNEVKQDIRKASDAASALATGAAVLQIGGILLCLMFVHLISHVAPGISLWLSYGIVGIAMLGLGSIVVYFGIHKFHSVDALSKQASQIMKDDAKWLSKPK